MTSLVIILLMGLALVTKQVLHNFAEQSNGVFMAINQLYITNKIELFSIKSGHAKQ